MFFFARIIYLDIDWIFSPYSHEYYLLGAEPSVGSCTGDPIFLPTSDPKYTKKKLMHEARSSQTSQTTQYKLLKIEKKIWEKTSDFKLHDEKKLLS